ncbi:MAG: hypothetical protein RLZZ428_933 [Pseudomonadota bacterium]|jgi:hypothetical protein
MKPELKLGRYRHYKGGEYEVQDLARHSESEEWMVVYKALYNDTLWVRPYEMFVQRVEVEGKEIERFTYEG